MSELNTSPIIEQNRESVLVPAGRSSALHGCPRTADLPQGAIDVAHGPTNHSHCHSHLRNGIPFLEEHFLRSHTFSLTLLRTCVKDYFLIINLLKGLHVDHQLELSCTKLILSQHLI